MTKKIKVHTLGNSSGARITFTFVNLEPQLPSVLRELLHQCLWLLQRWPRFGCRSWCCSFLSPSIPSRAIAFPKTSKNNTANLRESDEKQEDGDLGLNNTRYWRGINCINYIQSCMLPSLTTTHQCRRRPPLRFLLRPTRWSIRKLYTTPEKVSLYVQATFLPLRPNDDDNDNDDDDDEPVCAAFTTHNLHRIDPNHGRSPAQDTGIYQNIL